MGKTEIQWTDYSWNIARGCTKKNEDCLNCYMMRDSMNGTRYNPIEVVRTKTVFNLPDKIKEPGKKVFVSSLTDWAHEQIDGYRHEMWDIIRKNNHLTFQMLTKRWERLTPIKISPANKPIKFAPTIKSKIVVLPPDWGNGYSNVWLGVSTGSQKRYDEAMQYFKHVPAAVKWVSLEPLTGPIEDLRLKENGIQWVVVGGESGNDKGKWRYRPCYVSWLLDIVYQCKDAGVPVFVKQLGTYIAKGYGFKDRHGGEIEEWSSADELFPLQVREFPKH